MEIQTIVDKMLQKKYMLEMGAGKLSKVFNTTKDVIYQAKKLAKDKIDNISFPKILILDIETAPLRAYVWSRWKQNIYLEQTISEWFCLSWSAKWLFSGDIMSEVLTPEEVKREDDLRIMSKLWDIIDKCDVIVAHNGENFDIPKINSRFLINGLPPTSPYQQIDTKKIAVKQFGFSSNKLDALAGYFGIDHKMDTDFELWSKCMDGDSNALKYMEEYNRKDIIILEEVYLKMRSWIKNHPNVGLYLDLDIPVCSNCGNTELTQLETFYYTQTGKYSLYRCKCGAISRGRNTIQEKDKRRSLLIGVGR